MKQEDQEKLFERLLREKAERFQLKPEAEVWSGIENSISRRRNRKILWWSAAALLFVAAAGSYWLAVHENGGMKPRTSITEERRSNGNKTAGAEWKNSSPDKLPEKAALVSPGVADPLEENTTFVKRNGTNLFAQKKIQSENEYPVVAMEEKVTDPVFPNSHNQFNADLTPLYTGNFDLASFDPLMISPRFFAVESNLAPMARLSVEPTFSWVISHSASKENDITAPLLDPPSQSAWKSPGYSAGAAFNYHVSSRWLVSAGIHTTKTATQLGYVGQMVQVYDTVYENIGNMVVPVIDSTFKTIQPSEQFSQQWLELTLAAGIEIFPSGKNHLRIKAGGGYSRLLNVIPETNSQEELFSDSQSLGGSGTAVGGFGNGTYLVFGEDQWKLLAEADYVREISPRWNLIAGAQFHYYPGDLIANENVSQKLFWMGLRTGAVFRF
jgi:hypothetical protein